MVIFLLMLLACGTAALVVAAAWPAVRRAVTPAVRRPPAGPPHRPPAGPESIEGVLVAQLAAGAIRRHQYLRAMELVAGRDAERHPMRVPSDE